MKFYRIVTTEYEPDNTVKTVSALKRSYANIHDAYFVLMEKATKYRTDLKNGCELSDNFIGDNSASHAYVIFLQNGRDSKIIATYDIYVLESDHETLPKSCLILYRGYSIKISAIDDSCFVFQGNNKLCHKDTLNEALSYIDEIMAS